jgi:hypothetical protein
MVMEMMVVMMMMTTTIAFSSNSSRSSGRIPYRRCCIAQPPADVRASAVGHERAGRGRCQPKNVLERQQRCRSDFF